MAWFLQPTPVLYGGRRSKSSACEINDTYGPSQRFNTKTINPSMFPLKSELTRPLGKEQWVQRWGCSFLRVTFVTQLNVLLTESRMMTLGSWPCEMGPNRRFTRTKDKTFLLLHAWRRGTEHLVTLGAGSRVLEPQPELSIFPVFAARDYEKLLSTLKIIFIKPHQSFFK